MFNPNRVSKQTDEDSQVDVIPQTVSEVIEGLHDQLEVIGQTPSVIMIGRRMLPKLDVTGAQHYMSSLDTSPEEVFAILGEIKEAQYARIKLETSHEEIVMPRAPGEKSDDDRVRHEMMTTLLGIGKEKRRILTDLPDEERQPWDDLKRNILAHSTDNRKVVGAWLEGYDTIAEKYDAIVDAGKNPLDEGVSLLDTLIDMPPNDIEQRNSRSVNYLKTELGLGAQLAAEMSVGMRGRIVARTNQGEPDHDVINPHKQSESLTRIGDIVEKIGTDEVQRLREVCGIVNIGELTDAQVDRMVRFANSDPTLGEEMEGKEACVIIRDATSDWNGAFEGMSETYETVDGSTLIFEVTNMANGGRQMRSYIDLLQQAGIRPSAIIIAGHSQPGRIRMGEGELLARKPRDMTGWDSDWYATIEDAGVGDLIEHAKPDRDGNIHVIYKSCSSGGGAVHADDSTLVYTGKLARESYRHPGATVHIFGTEASSNLRLDSNGDMYDSYTARHPDKEQQPVTRIIVGQSGTVYQSREPQADLTVQIPMFDKRQLEEAA